MDNLNSKKLLSALFWADADNVYRTEFYVVKQKIYVLRAKNGKTYSISEDTYYPRFDSIDKHFEMVFADREPIDGKRLPASTFIRTFAL